MAVVRTKRSCHAMRYKVRNAFLTLPNAGIHFQNAVYYDAITITLTSWNFLKLLAYLCSKAH
jgi:hypothetical protein